ncbi:MAG: DUF1934 domain-containing protein [Roseburia sp.]|nr:DUF1934 domain-containing protein [Anaeroplasma bactoclasticum]MCM1195728.1 DUF1934 domain-containing protein [Roseburia sp.]MCM1556078.1 DUF1934 domain-containing protein [Anaeroplasma bactoclasticum]
MVVSFLSFDNEMNKTSFQSKAMQKGNEILFEDKSSIDTKIKITILENSLILERFGFIEMILHFCLDEYTRGTYRNKDGLEFDFEIYTKSLAIEKNKLKVSYDMLKDKEIINTFTFQVVLFQA